MDPKQDYKEAYERGKLHIRYLFIIACILAVIGISLALGKNSSALGQISMASTVSSIILSAIAIFMSISGENKLTYTHNKLLETSDRMSDITANIENANSMLDKTIHQELSKIDDIFDRLERIGQSVDNVEKEMLNRTFRINEDSTVNISTDTIWNIYNDMIHEVDEDNFVVQVTKEAIAYIVVCCSERHTIVSDNVEKYLKSVIDDLDSFSLGLAIGIICVFCSMGIPQKETIQCFENRLEISKEKRNKIKMFL